ncbi:MAG: hypothetical protein ABSB97_04315 [Thermoplasmata archaeon]|jgi:hypothetical protein
MKDPSSLSGRLVCEDESFHLSHQQEGDGRTYLGLLRIQTRDHVSDLGGLTEVEAERFESVIARATHALKECTGASWTYCLGFTEAFRHVHLVTASRYPETPNQYVRLAITDWPDAPRGSESEVAALCGRLRDRRVAPSEKGLS